MQNLLLIAFVVFVPGSCAGQQIGAYLKRGADWRTKGENDKADPTLAVGYTNRGVAWVFKNEFDKAIADFDEAMRLGLKNALVYENRGKAWQGNGDLAKAIADYTEAIRLDPTSAFAYQNRGWLRATSSDDDVRDGEKAIADAMESCVLTSWKNCWSLGTLAAAHAELGEYKQAIDWQQRALEIAPQAEKEQFHDRLELYQARKPYREGPTNRR